MGSKRRAATGHAPSRAHICRWQSARGKLASGKRARGRLASGKLASGKAAGSQAASSQAASSQAAGSQTASSQAASSQACSPGDPNAQVDAACREALLGHPLEKAQCAARLAGGMRILDAAARKVAPATRRVRGHQWQSVSNRGLCRTISAHRKASAAVIGIGWLLVVLSSGARREVVVSGTPRYSMAVGGESRTAAVS